MDFNPVDNRARVIDDLQRWVNELRADPDRHFVIIAVDTLDDNVTGVGQHVFTSFKTTLTASKLHYGLGVLSRKGHQATGRQGVGAVSATEMVAIVAVCDAVACMKRRNFIGTDLREAARRAGSEGWFFGERRRGENGRKALCPTCAAIPDVAEAI